MTAALHSFAACLDSVQQEMLRDGQAYVITRRDFEERHGEPVGCTIDVLTGATVAHYRSPHTGHFVGIPIGVLLCGCCDRVLETGPCPCQEPAA